MAIDSQIGPLLEQMKGAPSLSSGTPENGRDLLRRLLVGIGSRQPIELGSVEEIEVPGADGARPAIVYRPGADGSVPTLLFLHGGGFTVGDLEGYDWQARLLCRDVGAVVVSYGYRLAPEDPWPAAADDVMAALEWTVAHARELGGDRERIAIGGDSAGGNLSAVTAQAWKGREPALAAQLLLYPATDLAADGGEELPASVLENAEGYFLSLEDMLWFQANYLGEADPTDARISPALAGDLSGLPPAVVATAGYDPLRDDGEAYAEALSAAGVEVADLRFPALIHGFFAMGPISRGAAQASAAVCEALGELLAEGRRRP
ncbi:MAG: alpha/beta hydrolase [Solirubrobacterales bacterium]|nr:alpha/beta hydrolase [Solirubrobacterales bacterium]